MIFDLLLNVLHTWLDILNFWPDTVFYGAKLLQPSPVWSTRI